MSFGGLILTNGGRNKMAAAISEKNALKFTHIQLGDGTFNGSYNSKTELTHKVMEIPITRIQRKDNEVLIECDWNSKQAPTAFYLREIGIIGNGVLCYYDNARNGDAECIDPESETVSKQKRFRFTISVTDDANITTMISSELYALAEEVERSLFELEENKLDNTGDVKDTTVTFAEAEKRENINSGETLKVIFGKISKFFSDLKKVAFSGSYKDLSDKPTASDFDLGNVDNTSDLDKPVSTAQQKALDAHNTSSVAHTDIRDLIVELATRLNAVANSDDITLDQLSEIVAYIKSNRTLIESITTNKVNVADIVDSVTSTATNKPLSAKQGKVLNDLITETKKSVSDGKSAVASAITSAGVSTASDATFDTMANNINNIITGDASASNVLTGKTFSSKTAGRNTSGTMINNGAVSKELSAGGSYTVPTGYHNGSGKITAKSLASQTGVDSGKSAAGASQILTGYQAWVNGSKITGTIMDCRYTDIYCYGRSILAGDGGNYLPPYFAAYFLCHIGYDEFGLKLSASTDSSLSKDIYHHTYWQASNLTGIASNVQTFKSTFALDITNYTRMVVQIQANSAVHSGSEFLRGHVGVIPVGVSGSTGMEGATNMSAWSQYNTTKTNEWEWFTLEVDLSNLSGNHNFAISTVHGGSVQITGVTFLPKGR